MEITFDITPYIIWFFTWPLLIVLSFQAVKYGIKKWEKKNEGSTQQAS